MLWVFFKYPFLEKVNSMRHGVSYTRLYDAKPLPVPLIIHFQMNPQEHILMKFYLKFKHFLSKENTIKHVVY